MNSLEQFFHILYHHDLAKEENRRKGRTTPIKSPKLTMSFDFPDVDPPIVIVPHEYLSDEEKVVEKEVVEEVVEEVLEELVEEVVEGPKNLYNYQSSLYSSVSSRSRSSSLNGSSVINDDVASDEIKMMDASNDDVETKENDFTSFKLISSQTPSIRSCHHPKHMVYKKSGLTTDTFVKITRNLAIIVGIDPGLMICRGCMKQSHQDNEVLYQ